MENPIQITTKDPKKVEAGKRLAEYNKQQREKLKALEEKERREEFLKRNETIESTPSPTPSSESTESSSCETSYEHYGVAGLILVGGVMYYMCTREKPKKKRSVRSTQPTHPPQSHKLYKKLLKSHPQTHPNSKWNKTLIKWTKRLLSTIFITPQL